MGNACSRQDDAADKDPSSSQPRNNERRVTKVSSNDLTTTAKGEDSKEETTSASTKPPRSSEGFNEGSLSATPVFGGMKLVEEGEDVTPRSPSIKLSTTPPAPRVSIHQAIPIPTPKPPPKFNGRNSLGGGSSLAGVNYMLETGGASRSGFGASASISKAERGQQKRRRKVAQNQTAAATVMQTGFAPFNSPSESPKTSPASAASASASASVSPSVLTPTAQPQSRPIPTDLPSPDSPEIVEDFASLPMSSFVSDTKFGAGGITAVNTFKPSLTVIGSGDQPQLLGSGGLSARSTGSDQSGRASGRGATSERIRVTSFIGGPIPLMDAPMPPSPESTPSSTSKGNLQQINHDEYQTNMDDAEMLEAALGGGAFSQSSGGSTQTTSSVSPNTYTAPPSKQGTSTSLRAGAAPIELPSGATSAPNSARHRESIASNSTLGGSVNTPALLLRTLPDGHSSATEAGHGMLSTLRQEDNLQRVASTLTSFQKTSPRPQHHTNTNNNNISNRGSLGSFRHSLTGVAGPPPKRTNSNSKSLCSVCKTEQPQFYCADCVDVPFSLCEDCFHCLDDSAHDPSHRFEVIDGGSVFGGTSEAGTPIKSNDDDDFTDYSTSEVDEDEDFVGAADPEVPTALFDPCCSCSTQNYLGAIYRCRECAGYILCEKCFIRGKYRHPNTHTIRPVIQAPQVLARRRRSGDVKRVVTATKKDSSKTHDDSGNRVINNYVVIKEIGRGSYARVRLLQHLENKELFAVKVLRRELLGNPNVTSSSNTPHGGSSSVGPGASHLPLSLGSQSSSVNTVISPRQFASSQFSSQLMSGSNSIPNILPLRSQRHSSLCSDDGQHLVPPQTVMDSLREIAVLKLIDHPNVVKLVEVIDDEEGGKVYLIMEYLEGGCIHNLGEPPLSSEDLFSFTSDILASLLHMHSLMLYHQDVKPANCLLTKTGVAKIADFGTCDSRHKVNGVKGTPAFLSPELVMGVDTTGAMVDAWAFGVTLYQSASGELPFPITSMYAFNQAITSPKPVEIPSVVEDSDLRDLIALLLEKDINKRYNLIQAAEHPYYRRGADLKQGRARLQANMVFTPRYANTSNVAGISTFSDSTTLNIFHPASSLTSTDQNKDALANSRSDLLERAGGLIQKGSNVGKSFYGQQLVDRQLQRRIQREHRKNSDSVRSVDTGTQDGENSSRRKSSVTVVTPGEEKQLLNSNSAHQPQNHPNATTLINTYLEHVDALEHKSLNLSNAIIYKDSFLQVLPHTAPTLQSLLFFKNISLTSKVIKSIPWSTFKYLTRLRLTNCELTSIPLDILFGAGFELGLVSGQQSPSPVTSARQEDVVATAGGGSTSSNTHISDGPLSPHIHLQSPSTPSPNYNLPTFGGCPFLEKLDLSYNFIEEVPDVIGEYAALTSLDLEGNSITTFPCGKALKTLKKVNLSGNVIRNLPLQGLLDATGHGLQIAVDDHPNLKEEWARAVVSNSALRTITLLWTGIYPKQPAPAVVPQLLIGTLEQSLYFGSVKAEFDIRHFVVPSPMLEEFERMNQLSDRVMAAESLSLSSFSTAGIIPRNTPPESISPRTNENGDGSINNSANPISTLFVPPPLQSSTNTALPPPGEGGNTSSSHQSIVTIPNHHATSQNTIMNISAADQSGLFKVGSNEEYGSGGSGGGAVPTAGSVNTTTTPPSSFRASMNSSQHLASPPQPPVKSTTGPQQKRTPSPGTSTTVPTGSTSDNASPFTRSRYSHFAVTPTLIRRRSHRRTTGTTESRGGSLAMTSQTSISHILSIPGSKRSSSQHHQPPSQDTDKIGLLDKLPIAAKSQTAVYDSTQSSLNTENNMSSIKTILVADPSEQTNAFEETVGLGTLSPTDSGGLSQQQQPNSNSMKATLNNNLSAVMSMSAAIPNGATLVPTATMFIESPRSSPKHSLPPGTTTRDDSSHNDPSLDQSIDSLHSHSASSGPSRTVIKAPERKLSNPQYQHIYHGMYCFTTTDVSGPTMGARSTSSKEEMQVSSSVSTNYTTIVSSNEPALLRYLIENIVNRKESVLLLLDPTKLTRAEAALITHCARLLLVDHFGLTTEAALEALRSCGATATTPSPPPHLVTSSPESMSSNGTDSVIQQSK